jgi:hypothetical protein
MKILFSEVTALAKVSAVCPDKEIEVKTTL